MIVRIYHDKHYDFEIVSKDQIKDGDVFAVASKEDEVARRTVVDWPDNFTTVEVPDSIIDRYVEDRETLGRPVTRNRAVAAYLEQAAMTHHAEQEWWTHISVPDDADLEAYLNTVFELTAGEPAEVGPDPRVAATPVEAGETKPTAVVQKVEQVRSEKQEEKV